MKSASRANKIKGLTKTLETNFAFEQYGLEIGGGSTYVERSFTT